MACLTIHLLGPVQVTLHGEPVTEFESEKARALLAYLVAEPDRPHRHEALSETFWPGRAEGVVWANETIWRHDRIRRSELDAPTAVELQGPAVRFPGSFNQETTAVEPPVFVARDREMARLHIFLVETC
jgi:hypothetical protein